MSYQDWSVPVGFETSHKQVWNTWCMKQLAKVTIEPTSIVRIVGVFRFCFGKQILHGVGSDGFGTSDVGVANEECVTRSGTGRQTLAKIFDRDDGFETSDTQACTNKAGADWAIAKNGVILQRLGRLVGFKTSDSQAYY